MYDPCLHILIAQAAPYAHAISVFFCALKPNWLNSQLQSESSKASEVTRALGSPNYDTHTPHITPLYVVIVAEGVFTIKTLDCTKETQ